MNAKEIAEKFSPLGFEVSRVDSFNNPVTLTKLCQGDFWVHMALKTEQQNIIITTKIFKKFELRRSMMASVPIDEFTKELKKFLEIVEKCYG